MIYAQVLNSDRLDFLSGSMDKVLSPILHLSFDVYESIQYNYNMRRTQIYLEEKHHKFLTIESQKRGISVAEYIRELIDNAMPKEGDWKKHPFWSIGEDDFSTGEQRGSVEHDRIIYKTRRNIR